MESTRTILGIIGLSQNVFSIFTVINTNTNGNQNVGSGDSLTIINDATLNADITVNAGTRIIEDGASINGDIDAEYDGSLTIDNGNKNDSRPR